MGAMRTEGAHADGGGLCGRRGQQHCCWESLRDNSLVNLKVQPSQTELLFRSVANSFFAMRMGVDGNGWEPCGRMGVMGREKPDDVASSGFRNAIDFAWSHTAVKFK